MTATSLERKSFKKITVQNTNQYKRFKFPRLFPRNHHPTLGHRHKLQSKTISNLRNYQDVAQRNSVAECTFPVETNTHCRMLCHSMSRLVLDRMDNCQQQRSEHHLVQTLYTGNDNDMSRRCKDPSLARHINNCHETI